MFQYCKDLIAGMFSIEVPAGISIPDLLRGDIRCIGQYFGSFYGNRLRYHDGSFQIWNELSSQWVIQDKKQFKESLFERLRILYDHALEHIDHKSNDHSDIYLALNLISQWNYQRKIIKYIISDVIYTSPPEIPKNNIHHRYADFINARCNLGSKFVVSAYDLYNAYIEFSGALHDSYQKFGQSITGIKGIVRKKGRHVCYYGIGLREAA